MLTLFCSPLHYSPVWSTLLHFARLQFVLFDYIMLHSNLYQVRVCIILLSFTLFFSVIYSVTFPLHNIMLHYSFASEACLQCLPLHYIILQSDLINYILLHYSLFTLHYSFVSEVCLRCLPHYSLIYSVTFCYIKVWSAPLHYATLQLCIRGVFAVFGSPFRHSGCIVQLLSPPPICSLDWTLQCRMGWVKNLRLCLNKAGIWLKSTVTTGV